jgi:hypothetical protein
MLLVRFTGPSPQFVYNYTSCWAHHTRPQKFPFAKEAPSSILLGATPGETHAGDLYPGTLFWLIRI